MKNSQQFDFSAFSIGTLADDDRGRFWSASSSEDRLIALEVLRQVMYDYDPISDRIPRILEVAELTCG